MKLSFPTKVINGQISSNRQPIAQAIKSFEGKEIALTIERKRKKRSNEQNAYLWGVVYPILKDGFYQIGYKLTTEQVHELMKQAFVKEDLINETTGEVKTITGSTADLTTSQFMEYLADIKQFAAEELNVYIPDPNEQVTFNF